MNTKIKKIAFSIFISLFGLFSFTTINSFSKEINTTNFDSKIADPTAPIGPRIFETYYTYNEEEGTATLFADYISGRGTSSEEPCEPAYMGITPDSEPIASNADNTWNNVNLVEEVTSPTNWIPDTTASDTEISPTTLFHSELELTNVPSGFNFDDYYTTIEVHGASGAKYTYYETAPITFSALEDPSEGETIISEYSTTSVTMHSDINAGIDPYGDAWTINEESLDFSNYEDQGLIVTTLGSTLEDNILGIDYQVSGLTPYTTYDPTTFSISFEETHLLDETIVVEQNLPEFTSSKTAPIIDNFELVSESSDSVKVSWSFTDEYEAITKVSVLDSTTLDEVASSTSIPLSGSTTLSGLSGFTNYEYILNVEFDDGNNLGEVESTPVSFTTLKTAPTIDTFTISDRGSDNVEISWNVIDINDSITELKVVNSEDETDTIISSTTAPLSGSTTIPTLTSNTNYNWKLVVSYNNTVEDLTIESGVIDFTTLKASPSITNASILSYDKESVNINYDIVDDDFAITDVVVINTLDDSEVTSLGVLNGTGEETIDKLDSNTNYSWRLKAKYNNGQDDGEVVSDIITFTTLKNEPSIIDFNISKNSETSVEASWDINDTDLAITSISLYDSINSTEVMDLTSLEENSTIVNGLNETTEYTWKLIIDYNDNLNTGTIESDEISFTTVLNLPSIIDVDVTQISSSSASIEWDILDSDSTITSIEVIDKNSLSQVLTSTSTSGAKVINNLDSNTNYNWGFVVNYNNGVTDTSLEEVVLNFTTLKTSPEIKEFEIETIDGYSVEVSWNIFDLITL